MDGKVREPFNDFKYIKKFRKGFTPLSKVNKQILDYDNIDGVIGLGHETPSLYKDTYFSIVTETLFFEESEFVSEKTFKPISQLHPFVVLGSPNTLSYFYEYGFKTFSKWWDESYDTELDNTKRFIKVWEVSKSLIEKSDEEWIEMLKEMKEILIYNRNLFLQINKSLTSTINDNIKKIFNNESLQFQ